MSATVRTYVGDEVRALLPALAELRVRIFADYPYLYEGDEASEREYLKVYAESEGAIVVVAEDDGAIVGASTGLPLAHEPETDDFREVGRRFGRFDLVMLEIGAWHPAWGSIHLGPENALKAFEMLGGDAFFPIHWSTFDLGLHPWEEPAETLVERAREHRARVITPRLGRPFEPERVEEVDPWWREVRR